MLSFGFIPEIPPLTARVAGASAIIALSSFNAFAEPAQIVAISGRDQLALHDLATGAELSRSAAASRCQTTLPGMQSSSSTSSVVAKSAGCPRRRLAASVPCTCI